MIYWKKGLPTLDKFGAQCKKNFPFHLTAGAIVISEVFIALFYTALTTRLGFCSKLSVFAYLWFIVRFNRWQMVLSTFYVGAGDSFQGLWRAACGGGGVERAA